MPDAAEKLLADHGLTIDDIDVIVAHQANERILDGVRKRLDLGADKAPQNLNRYGNTTAGTLPILYHFPRTMMGVFPTWSRTPPQPEQRANWRWRVLVEPSVP